MKIFRLYAFLAVFALILAGCSDTGETNEAAADEKKDEKKEQFELRLGTVVSAPHPWIDMSEFFAEEVEKRTDGNVKVAIHPSGSLGSDETMIEELRLGTVDFIIGGTQNAAAYIPQLQIFGLSYLFDDMDHFKKAISNDSPLYEFFEKEYENKKLDMKLLTLAGGGTRYLSNNVKEIGSVDDLKGIKMRIPSSPIESKIWGELGALPSPLAWNEVYSAIQTGVVNAFESTLSGYTGSKLNEVAPYMSLTEHLFMASHFSISEHTYKKLPEEYVKIIEEVAKEAGEFGTQRGIEMDEEIMAELPNLKVTVTEVDKQEFIDILAPLQEELAKELKAEELIEVIRDLR